MWPLPRAGTITVALAVVLAGCGNAPSRSAELLTPPPSATPSSTAVAGSPTGAPPLETPAELDRRLEDTEAFRTAREELVSRWIEPQVEDRRVLTAMRAVPRHAFVPTQVLDEAYGDYPLPLGHGQTISQPSLVALMTEMLDLAPGEKVLEVGTGSGYQAAILREMTDRVYSVEVIPVLAGTARRVLDELGYRDIAVARRDGYLGWEEHAPYDAIVVTAAPDHLPQALVAQLKPDGRMVIPIGPVGDVQTLWLVTREGGETRMERKLEVRFVPLVREDEVPSALRHVP